MDYIEFVKTWQRAKSVKEVAEKMGIAQKSASTRARNLRANGVALKKMSGGGGKRLDYNALKDVAKAYTQ